MFERRLLRISATMQGKRKTFYRITHTKHRREIYFQNIAQAISFMRTKFNSPFKQGIYWLIRARVLPLFLPKLSLHEGFGEVIFVGGQIKGFNLKGKKVLSFPLHEKENKTFLQSKKAQRTAAKKGFAPTILSINAHPLSCEEELLTKYSGGREVFVFKRLMEYYDTQQQSTVSLGTYLTKLEKNAQRLKDPGHYIRQVIAMIEHHYPKTLPLQLTNVHGDFSPEQVLKKGQSYVFVDWNTHTNIITKDLVNYFREEIDFLGNATFRTLLSLYPKDVQRNIALYIVLTELFTIISRGMIPQHAQERINCILQTL